MFEQVVDTLSGFRRHRHKGRLTAKLFWHNFFDHQLVLDALHVRVGLVDLVDRHHDGHASGFGVFDGFAGLRHDTVVCSHHQYDNVCRLGTARTHGREGLVARRVQKRDHAARRFHVVSADVLGDTTSLT